MMGDPGTTKKKKSGDGKMDKAKQKAAKDNQKRAAQKLGDRDVTLDIIDEVENYSDDTSMSEDLGDDKYDPRAKVKEGGIAFKKQNKMATALEHAALELGKAMPILSRGPEIELSTIRDVEDLKQTLA